MNVLVTGGAGYIGSHTVVELMNAGHEVVIVDNLSNASADVIDRIEKITGKAPEFYRINCCSEILKSIFARHRIDAVIHFAGYKAVGESVRMPLQYYRNNIDSTLSLLEAMEYGGCKKLVFSSSATVYGPDNPIPTRKKCPPCSLPAPTDGRRS